ncbi:hypothetical protein AAF712_013414 [Marasmius tenuissimus]|uniref:AA9 family lytic polysaccharide monooxygenase n=1 Tax=Marasmius tenuissimus TaxID=585030 RepID=A0ABR2ZEP7_9AGAR
MKLSFAVAAALYATSASAHTIFQEISVNGVAQGRTHGIRVPTFNGIQSSSKLCSLIKRYHLQRRNQPYKQPVSQAVVNVPAGATITTQWNHDLNGPNPSNGDDPISPTHKGPILTYLARIPDATQSTVTGLQWLKIYEDGYDSSTGLWAVDKMISAQGKVTFTIPKCIPSGQYLMRHEIIALHSAGQYPGAHWFYMECAQINVTDGGNASSATVSFPGAYEGTDPGVTFNLYWPPFTSYTIPGPKVFTC